MERSVDDVVRDDKYGYHIRLYLAIKTDGDLNIQEESELLFNLYTYMEQKRNKDKDVVLAVAYIRSDKFADSEQLLRRSHALNFDWDMMEQGAVIYQIYFGSGNDIQGPEYFSKFFK